MKKNVCNMLVSFLTPALLIYLLAYLYPTVRTFLMSFFYSKSLSEPIQFWQFVGLDNYRYLLDSKLFLISLANIAKIWIIGGTITFIFAFVFAIILHAGVKGKQFWKAVIYLPNVISAIAMATMWNLYVYSPKYGLLKNVFSLFGLDKFASIQWTSPDNIFMAMLVAFSFGSVGFFMLVILSGMERIPHDYYEAALLDGAGIVKQFFKVTLPLLKPVIVTCLIFWTINVIGFFTWTQIFSSTNNDVATITPVVYLFNYAFGSGSGSAETLNAGLASAIGVVLSVITVVMFLIINTLNRGERYEY